MSEGWALPGYDVQALLGCGASGEVWRAREVATGETVALRRLRSTADPAAVDALRREALVLRTLDTPYVVRLREVVGSGAGSVLVLDHAPGGSLAALLARRGTLEPGEVVTVAAPLAQALAAAHARGLVHGDVTPANVLFTADGMPLLSDLGLARFAGERLARLDGTAEHVDPAVAAGGEPDAAADVWALAAVCHHMLAGSAPHDGGSVDGVRAAAAGRPRSPLGLLVPGAPRPLVEAVEAALVADPAGRPDAAGFASLLRRAHAAAPVRLAGGLPAAGSVPGVRAAHADCAVADHEPATGRRRVPQGVLLGAGLAGLVAAAAVGGWLSGRGSEQVAVALPVSPPPSAVAPSVPAAIDLRPVLEALDAERAGAFAAGDRALLERVWAPGSPGLAADTALLRPLVEQRQTAQGLRHEVRSVAVLSQRAGAAELRVVDVLSAYEVRAADGSVVSRAPARGEQAFRVSLVQLADGWRLVQVRPEG